MLGENNKNLSHEKQSSKYDIKLPLLKLPISFSFKVNYLHILVTNVYISQGKLPMRHRHR